MTLSKDEKLDLVATWIGDRLYLRLIQEKKPFVGIDHNQNLRDEEKVIRKRIKKVEEEMWELGLVKRKDQ